MSEAFVLLILSVHYYLSQ